MLNTYPDTFTFVQIHLDAYGIPWGYSRMGFYNIEYTPTAWFDGMYGVVGDPYPAYQDRYNTRIAVPTDVTIGLAGEPISGSTFAIVATVCVEAGGVAKDMRIQLVQVLDNWPSYPSYSRNGLKQAAASEDISLAAGECTDILRTFTFDGESWANQEDIKIIAWAQKQYGSGPAEVNQAANMPWPFPPPGLRGDFDDDGDVDADDRDQFIACFTGPDGGPLGPECTRGDFDWDDDIDCDDWGGFLLAWTEPGDPPEFETCDVPPPQMAPEPHNTFKNRYISFDPNHSGYSVAYHVEMTACTYFPGSVGLVGWVGEPFEAPDYPGEWIAPLGDVPFYSDSWPALLHVRDCEIVPAAAYALKGTVDGTNFTDRLGLGTIFEPTPKKWGDVVGFLYEGAWTGPNVVVNMDDVMASVQRFQQLESAPHFTWVDVDEEIPNLVVNFTDIMRVVQGFKGEDYPFSDPAACE